MFLSALERGTSRGSERNKENYHHMPLYRLNHVLSSRSYTEPITSENPLNAWSFRIEIDEKTSVQTVIKPTGTGPLSGKTVAIKDNVSVAGLPLTGGTHPYHLSKDQPYPISTFDAPVVTRVLEAGATVIGTSTCENYCMSALSFTSATGPVDNPWLQGYECGGSSSGSAALVGIKSVRDWQRKHKDTSDDKEDDKDHDKLGEGADFALGADQGGSIRQPAGYSGIYGLKPTHGLVPYTGLTALYPAIDHCGPIAGSVRDTALLLAVLAGYDGLDPRMTPETPLRQNVAPYHELLDAAIETRKAAGDWTPTTAARGLRIGILKEAWSAPQLSAEVAAVVHKAGERFGTLGGVVEEVSVPLHMLGADIFTAVTRADMADVFIYNKPPDLLSWPLADLDPPVPNRQWYQTMNKAAPTVVNKLLNGTFLNQQRDRFPLAARGKAVTHAHELRAAYVAALDKYDVLILPVNPTVAMRHPTGELSVRDKQALALGNTWNTCPFNLTGHPGLVIPVGWGQTPDGQEKLPIGMQMIGKRWGEEKLFLAAAAWEVGGFGLDP
ncbi:amidase signature enzyme [Cryphonectria parasitica EP155]|uniref:Amidase signature enzyme n=1 Tax=Cryphonectria parasitica (strain ATCC 38755 / EP155) TaxID=660469 RepID=A0A9P4XY90_CRYP1|nr:amidase signature enzyme [Cryphonectria parasitica EP155]KAF3762985.1 amidase signature enzyme [Cryphonectria parasitica EP155]